jgi:integrase
MAKGRNRLTARAIDTRKQPGRMFDGAGLILNITASGSRHWIFRYTLPKNIPAKGKTRIQEMGLGPYPDVSLAMAREKADLHRSNVAAGLDPKNERDKETGKTFGEVADSYIVSMQGKWSNDKSIRQWKDTVDVKAKAIRDRPIADIETADILKVLQPIWQKTPETASRVRGRLENILDYAKAHHWRTGENPARWRGHLSSILPPRQKHTIRHFPAMPYRDIPAFIERVQANPGLSSRAMELLILTASRTSEVLNAQWSEFDLDEALWIIPAVRMKVRVEHRVPLVPRALEILQPLYEDRYTDYVFPGQKHGRPLSNMALEMVLRRMKVEGVTVHGFRSSFRDWCGDETSFPREIAEAALAHTVGSNVERSYRRGDALEKRRRLMEAWADYCGGNRSEKVVSLHG